MNLKRKPLTMFVALLMFGLSPEVVWSNAGAKSAENISQTQIAFDDEQAAFANELYGPSIIGDVLAISDTTLDEMRGGFTTTSGLQVVFGIERALYVNGELISTTSLNVVNLGNVNVTPNVPTAADLTANLPNAAELSTPTITLPQINSAPATSSSVPSSAASSSPIPSVSAPSTSASASSTPATSSSSVESSNTSTSTSTSTSAPATSTSVASSNVSPPTQISTVTSTPGSVALIQSGAGNTVSTGTFSTTSLGTVVQNTLNNQKIQNVAVISATVNSMEILKALNLQSAISSAINDAVLR